MSLPTGGNLRNHWQGCFWEALRRCGTQRQTKFLYPSSFVKTLWTVICEHPRISEISRVDANGCFSKSDSIDSANPAIIGLPECASSAKHFLPSLNRFVHFFTHEIFGACSPYASPNCLCISESPQSAEPHNCSNFKIRSKNVAHITLSVFWPRNFFTPCM